MKSIILSALIFLLLPQGSSFAGDLNPLLDSSSKERHARVAKVLAVDLLLMDNGDKIKLIGIKGPKPPMNTYAKRDANGFIIPETDPTTPVNLEAFRFVKSLAEEKTVTLEFDVERRDAQGFLQAYVFLPDGRLLNGEVLRNGFANLKLVFPNMRYADKLRSMYKEARREMRGIQSDP